MGSLLLRLGRALRLGCCAGLSLLLSAAHAAGTVPAGSGYQYRLAAINNTPATDWHSTPEAVGAQRCAQDLALLPPQYAPCTATVSGNPPSGYVIALTFAGGANYQQQVQYQTGATCPAGSQNNGVGGCDCDPNFRPNAGGTTCEAYTCTPGTQRGGVGVYEAANPLQGLDCVNGCRVDGTAGGTYQDGRRFVWGPLTEHWQVCADLDNLISPTSQPNSPAPSASQPGTCYGTINGQTVAHPCASTTSTTTTNTTSTPTSASGVPGAPTVTSETTTVTCADGVCTTTTTRRTTNADGTVNETVTTETGAQNPTGVVPPGSGGSGTGSGGEGCAANPSASGCGGEPGAIGELYTPKGDTLQGVMSNFRDEAMSTPMGSAVGGFFTVSGGGSCPTWSGTIPYIEYAYTLDQFCSEFAGTALLLLRAAVLLVCSFFAFRVAIDN